SGLPDSGPAGAVHPSELLPAGAQAVPLLKSAGVFAGGSAAPDESDRPLSWRNKLPEYVLRGARCVPDGCPRTGPERSGVQQVGPMKIARSHRDHTTSKVA